MSSKYGGQNVITVMFSDIFININGSTGLEDSYLHIYGAGLFYKIIYVYLDIN